ncbi:MAG: hypothetical protein ACREMB_09125 [Candidatus Rokuibacteriota bacterium]
MAAPRATSVLSAPTGPARLPVVALAALVGLGALAFLLGVLGGRASRTWAAFLVNLLFWSGLSAAGPAIAGMFELTEARWAGRLRRIATTTVAFMPVSFFLLLVFLTALRVLYPWVTEPIPSKAVWLNQPFFILRLAVGVAALYWVSIAFARAVHGSPAGASEEPDRGRRTRLAVVLLFLYVIVISLVGFDLIMTLDAHWFSGLLGGYFLVGTLYSGFAFLVVLVGVASLGRPAWVVPPTEVQDLAKLVFATSILWMYFFWSQYLVIWYGNVPIEVRFVLERLFADPWRVVAIVAFFAGWLIPFSYLLVRLTGRPPESHRVLVGVSCLVLAAMFLERTVLVFPSIVRHTTSPYAVIDILVTLGFAALFILSYRIFVPRLGLVSRLDG